MKILFVLLITFFVALSSVIKFKQNDYRVVYEHAFVEKYNKTYLSNAIYMIRRFNRTSKEMYFNFDLIMDIDNMQVHFESQKLYSNEYRGFPIGIDVDGCREFSNPILGFDDLKRYSNLTNCPIVKGRYVSHGFLPDETNFPPFIPYGRYKNIMTFYHNSTLFLELHLFTENKAFKIIDNKTILYR